ncbi:PepSY-like domain-containing protein [Cellulophaga sp. L1A9]|uniref:PepSY-like domain-containing protein n=1 Tax=Cellulophaga sp. L1A9 TaxID=2686362 RepID=UPI00131E15EE|nr:PepSY-like domain-containing protein [Cellulophaga sp. L1A9]
MKRSLKHSLADLLYAAIESKQDLPRKIILESFELKYPKALYTTWQLKDNAIWEAAFFWEKKEHTALFTKNGLWMETHTYLPLGKVPKIIQQKFNMDYPRNLIQGIFILKKSEEVFYEFLIRLGNKEYKARYSVDGEKKA